MTSYECVHCGARSFLLSDDTLKNGCLCGWEYLRPLEEMEELVR